MFCSSSKRNKPKNFLAIFGEFFPGPAIDHALYEFVYAAERYTDFLSVFRHSNSDSFQPNPLAHLMLTTLQEVACLQSLQEPTHGLSSYKVFFSAQYAWQIQLNDFKI